MKNLPDPKDRVAIRKALARELGRKSIPTDWWLSELTWSVDEFQKSPSKKTWQDLVDEGRDLQKSAKPPRRMTKPQVEILRAKVTSLHYARLASRLESVKKLWEELFGNKPLSPDEVDSLLAQKGLGYFSTAWFARRGIPILGHRSYFLNPKNGGNARTLTPDTVLRFEWGGAQEDVPGVLKILEACKAKGPLIKLRTKTNAAMALTGSVFDRIRSVASSLVGEYDWSERDAVEFLLTRRGPLIQPIELTTRIVGAHPHQRIVAMLEVEPWVSPGSVLSVYRAAQRALYGKQTGPGDRRQLMLFHHINEYCMAEFGKPWEELAQERVDFRWRDVAHRWNRENPKWRYSAGYRMKRAFMKTHDRLLHPDLRRYMNTVLGRKS